MTKYGKPHLRRLVKPKRERQTDMKLGLIKLTMAELGVGKQFDEMSRQRDMLKYI